jgi:hypothetical protein
MFGTARTSRRWKRVPVFPRIQNVLSKVSPLCRFLVGVIASVALLLGPIGCTTERTPIIRTSLTGNWVLETTPTSSISPFTSLSGFINQETMNYAASNAVTAALEAQPDTCYLGADLIPLSGTVKGVNLGLHSFDVNGQYLTISGTSDSNGSHLTGTYSVAGGCANRAAGTFTGTRYAVLTGSYAGTFSANRAYAVQMTLTQNVLGTGSGNFFVSGTATFAGISCLTSGTMTGGAGSIIGNTVQLDFTTNDANGAQVLVSGTIDPTAKIFTVSTATVNGGSCAGSLGQATLTLQ